MSEIHMCIFSSLFYQMLKNTLMKVSTGIFIKITKKRNIFKDVIHENKLLKLYVKNLFVLFSLRKFFQSAHNNHLWC